MFRKPSGDAIRWFLSSQEVLAFSYKGVGLSREGVAPPGYAVDRYRLKLGEGSEAYERAVEALRGWRQFNLDWCSFFHRRRLSRSLRQWSYVSATTASGH